MKWGSRAFFRITFSSQPVNLGTAVGRKTNVEDMGVPSEIKKFVVTSGVMRHFFILPGTPRACVDFCDPTAVSRLKCAGQRVGKGFLKKRSGEYGE